MRPVHRQLIVAVALAALALPAAAQDDPGASWTRTPIEGGCMVMTMSEPPPAVTMTWGGACVRGQPISGRGTLTIAVSEVGPTPGAVQRGTMSGAFVAGVPNGAFVMETFDRDGQSLSRETHDYNMGCPSDTPSCTPYLPN